MIVRRVSARLAFLALVCAAPITAIPVASSAIAAPQASRLGIQAAEAAFDGKFEAAGDFARRSGDPAAMKLVELVFLRDQGKHAGFSRILEFLAAAPLWPLSESLGKRAEQALYVSKADPQTVRGYFKDRKPLTSEGMLALARAELAAGNSGEARKWVARAYAESSLSDSLEKSITAEFGNAVSSAEHKRRLWDMVYLQETNAAIRTAKHLPGEYQAAAKAAQALIRGAPGAEKLYSGLSASMRRETAVQYALARHYRKLNKDAKARAILLKLPSGGTEAAAEALWVERRIIVRRSLGPANRDNWKAAYQLARAHGTTQGSVFAEGEFLAGWIALRSLRDPRTAHKHFARLEAGAPNRTERARAHYWLGRTNAALGADGKAKEAYRQASAFSTIFYGQLAREQMGLGKQPVKVTGGQPSAAAMARVENDEVVRALRMVHGTGRTKELNLFLWSLSRRFKTVDEMNAVASIAWDLGGPAYTVRFAKLASQQNLDVDYWGYPTKALPDWKSVGKPVEHALVYGLSRQESEFDAKAGSRVGAQGLMQIMPATAKIIAGQHRLPYQPAKLTGDPSYNVKLGAAHLGDLVEDFNGSYILTLVAYNAGPRRVREWVAAFGDPRGETDPIDWVESIPFQETRQYVQKVLQNVHVYRSRLAPETMTSMTADLRRGAPKAISVANSAEQGTAAAACGIAGDDIKKLIETCTE